MKWCKQLAGSGAENSRYYGLRYRLILGRIALLENAVEKIYSKLDEVKDMLVTSRDLLASHTRQEAADRLKLMYGIVATLVSVLVSAGGTFFICC